MELIFKPNDSGTTRVTGYATVPYYSDSEDETVVSTTEGGLSTIFEDAKSNGETIDGADSSIDDAIDNPIAFRSFLILVDGTIEFDS